LTIDGRHARLKKRGGAPRVRELIGALSARAGRSPVPIPSSILQRSPSVPTIPTCDELGLKGFDIATVMGLHAPAGAPPKVVARLQAEAAKTMREHAMAARMKQLGMVMEENGTANYQKFMLDDLERYAVAVRKLNLQTN